MQAQIEGSGLKSHVKLLRESSLKDEETGSNFYMAKRAEYYLLKHSGKSSEDKRNISVNKSAGGLPHLSSNFTSSKLSGNRTPGPFRTSRDYSITAFHTAGEEKIGLSKLARMTNVEPFLTPRPEIRTLKTNSTTQSLADVQISLNRKLIAELLERERALNREDRKSKEFNNISFFRADKNRASNTFYRESSPVQAHIQTMQNGAKDKDALADKLSHNSKTLVTEYGPEDQRILPQDLSPMSQGQPQKLNWNLDFSISDAKDVPVDYETHPKGVHEVDSQVTSYSLPANSRRSTSHQWRPLIWRDTPQSASEKRKKSTKTLTKCSRV